MNKTRKSWLTVVAAGIALGIPGPLALDAFLRLRFNSAISSLRNESVTSIRFKPHVDREFVSISDLNIIAHIQTWLGKSETPKAFHSYPPASCELEIVFANGNVERFMISPTGLTLNSDESLEQFQLRYVMLTYGGYYRLLPNQPFSTFLRSTDQMAAKPVSRAIDTD